MVLLTISVMICTAVATVYVGCIISTSESHAAGFVTNTSGEREVVELTYSQAVLIPVSSSICLLLLFFFFDFLQYALLLLLIVSAACSLWQLLSFGIHSFSWCLGSTVQRHRYILSLCITLIGVVDWIVTGSIIWHNILGCSLCVLFISTMQFPSLKIASLCLVLLTLYDIFWVFCSEYFFAENVMVDVATKVASNPIHDVGTTLKISSLQQFVCPTLELPIKLIFPSNATGRQMMLGLGDIALPGALVSLALRCDKMVRCSSEIEQSTVTEKLQNAMPRELECGNIVGGSDVGNAMTGMTTRPMASAQSQLYTIETKAADTSNKRSNVDNLGLTRASNSAQLFEWAMFGYFIGLISAFVGNFLTGSPQPALIYLVPSVLLFLLVRAWKVGVLNGVWAGPVKIQLSD